MFTRGRDQSNSFTRRTWSSQRREQTYASANSSTNNPPQKQTTTEPSRPSTPASSDVFEPSKLNLTAPDVLPDKLLDEKPSAQQMLSALKLDHERSLCSDHSIGTILAATDLSFLEAGEHRERLLRVAPPYLLSDILVDKLANSSDKTILRSLMVDYVTSTQGARGDVGTALPTAIRAYQNVQTKWTRQWKAMADWCIRVDDTLKGTDEEKHGAICSTEHYLHAKLLTAELQASPLIPEKMKNVEEVDPSELNPRFANATGAIELQQEGVSAMYGLLVARTQAIEGMAEQNMRSFWIMIYRMVEEILRTHASNTGERKPDEDKSVYEQGVHFIEEDEDATGHRADEFNSETQLAIRLAGALSEQFFFSQDPRAALQQRSSSERQWDQLEASVSSEGESGMPSPKLVYIDAAAIESGEYWVKVAIEAVPALQSLSRDIEEEAMLYEMNGGKPNALYAVAVVISNTLKARRTRMNDNSTTAATRKRKVEQLALLTKAGTETTDAPQMQVDEVEFEATQRKFDANKKQRHRKLEELNERARALFANPRELSNEEHGSVDLVQLARIDSGGVHLNQSLMQSLPQSLESKQSKGLLASESTQSLGGDSSLLLLRFVFGMDDILRDVLKMARIDNTREGDVNRKYVALNPTSDKHEVLWTAKLEEYTIKPVQRMIDPVLLVDLIQDQMKATSLIETPLETTTPPVYMKSMNDPCTFNLRVHLQVTQSDGSGPQSITVTTDNSDWHHLHTAYKVHSDKPITFMQNASPGNVRPSVLSAVCKRSTNERRMVHYNTVTLKARRLLSPPSASQAMLRIQAISACKAIAFSSMLQAWSQVDLTETATNVLSATSSGKGKYKALLIDPAENPKARRQLRVALALQQNTPAGMHRAPETTIGVLQQACTLPDQSKLWDFNILGSILRAWWLFTDNAATELNKLRAFTSKFHTVDENQVDDNIFNAEIENLVLAAEQHITTKPTYKEEISKHTNLYEDDLRLALNWAALHARIKSSSGQIPDTEHMPHLCNEYITAMAKSLYHNLLEWLRPEGQARE